MSNQLAISATLSALAMAALCLALGLAAPVGDGARGATAHGSLIGVLLRP
jgi:hypothetical protein